MSIITDLQHVARESGKAVESLAADNERLEAKVAELEAIKIDWVDAVHERNKVLEAENAALKKAAEIRPMSEAPKSECRECGPKFYAVHVTMWTPHNMSFEEKCHNSGWLPIPPDTDTKAGA